MDKARPQVSTDAPEPSVIDALHLTSLDALRRAVDPVRDWVVSDLSLGSWRSAQVATEFCAQLGVQGPLPPAHLVGDAVAAEDAGFQRWLAGDYYQAHGERSRAGGTGPGEGPSRWAVPRLAHSLAPEREVLLAERVLGALRGGSPRLLLVFAPLRGLPWEAEDLQFMKCLAVGLRDTGSRMLILCRDGAAQDTPTGLVLRWLSSPGPTAEPTEQPGAPDLVRLVPGVVEPTIAAALLKNPESSACLQLASGHLLVAPEWRRVPGQVSRLHYDRLAVASAAWGWLRAYAQYFGNSFFTDSVFLCTEAAWRMHEGGPDVGMRLLQRAIACSRGHTHKAIFQLRLQGWRIALARHEEAGGEPDPSPSYPSVLRGALLQCKGWGLALSGQTERAEPYLRTAAELLAPTFAGTQEFQDSLGLVQAM